MLKIDISNILKFFFYFPLLQNTLHNKDFSILVTSKLSCRMWHALFAACHRFLLHLQDNGNQGEGYQSADTKSSPHTVNERYVGLVPKQLAEVFFWGFGGAT